MSIDVNLLSEICKAPGAPGYEKQIRELVLKELMHTLCRDDGGSIVPFFRNRVMGRRDNVMHAESIASNWELDGARGYERWWFA